MLLRRPCARHLDLPELLPLFAQTSRHIRRLRLSSLRSSFLLLLHHIFASAWPAPETRRFTSQVLGKRRPEVVVVSACDLSSAYLAADPGPANNPPFAFCSPPVAETTTTRPIMTTAGSPPRSFTATYNRNRQQSPSASSSAD